MNKKQIIGTLAALVLFGCTVSSVFATNGYFRHGYGTQYRGMAGAGTALALSSLAGATNPASMVFVGKRYDVGIAFFSPDRQYTVTGNPSGAPGTFGLAPGTVVSDSKSFFMPSLGGNWMLNDQTSFGVSVYGNGGMNTNYESTTFGATPTGVDLAQAFVAVTLARKITEEHAVGITPILAYQRFQAEGLGVFGQMGFSSDAANLSDNDHENSLGVGARIGYLGNFGETISVGASYQTKMRMSEFSGYAGLFAGQGDFDVPASWSAGIAIHATSALTLAVDLQQIFYSNIESVNNPFLPNIQAAQLGNDNGAGFGWKDMTIFKIGAQWQANDAWTLRGGFSFGEQPIPDTEVLFNILAPGVMEQHATFGLSKTLNSGRQIHLAFMHAFSKSVSGANPLEAPNQQTIDLEMKQWEFDVSFGL